jgi:hypothetical protein
MIGERGARNRVRDPGHLTAQAPALGAGRAGGPGPVAFDRLVGGLVLRSWRIVAGYADRLVTGGKDHIAIMSESLQSDSGNEATSRGL